MTRGHARQLGRRLRARRLACKLSQAALAEKVHLSPNYIGLLERGEKSPTLETLFELARALKVSPADLLDEPLTQDEWLEDVLATASTIPPNRRSLALALLKTIAAQA